MSQRTVPLADLRQLRYFVTVVEELHFGRAAARLGITQPPLSEQIRLLEERIGVRLLERTRRHVALTPQGRALYDEAVNLLAHAERVRQVMVGARAGRLGHLFLGCVPSGLFGALPAIIDRRRASGTDLEIRVTEAHTADILAAVLDGRLDAGLVWDDQAAHPLAIRPLDQVRFTIALHRSHRMAHAKSIALSALADEPLILPPRAVTPHQFDRIITGFRKAGLSPSIAHEARSIAAQLGFVASGLGYALVPEYARKLAMPDVVFKPLREPIESVPLSLVWNENRVSSQLETFARLAAAAFPTAPPGAKRRRFV